MIATRRPFNFPVPGAPVQPGAWVHVIQTDPEDIAYLDKTGKVVYLEYDCGCGQTFPTDPMIGVEFTDLPPFEFWQEELEEWEKP